jgi:hypothetical protein
VQCLMLIMLVPPIDFWFCVHGSSWQSWHHHGSSSILLMTTTTPTHHNAVIFNSTNIKDCDVDVKDTNVDTGGEEQTGGKEQQEHDEEEEKRRIIFLLLLLVAGGTGCWVVNHHDYLSTINHQPSTVNPLLILRMLRMLIIHPEILRARTINKTRMMIMKSVDGGAVGALVVL